jgi:Spy/CpxP family protein refolding chaperone
VPILSQQTLPAQSLDWSRVCGQYLSLKLQHLSENLALTDDQQAEIKPILEQESGEVSEICGNPVLSRKDTLSQYEKILQASDEKIKPLLSTSQLQKLQDLRRNQKQDVKRIVTEQKSSKQN